MRTGAGLFLGIDVGTSAVKATLVDERGRVAGTASQAHPAGDALTRLGLLSRQPRDWWAATAGAVKKALRAAKVRASRVAGVGLSGQMHSSVFLDAKNAVIRPALLWCDGRTTEECRQITARIGEEQLRALGREPRARGLHAAQGAVAAQP